MIYLKEDLLKKHISTHTIHSAEDRAAVSTLETYLISNGRINTNFSCDDKWPNHDGTFEFVSNPDFTRIPEQNFIVQIKGTHSYTEKDGEVSYSLKSLAFPAFIASEVTADPGIIFVVLNPDIRGEKRVFWKYLSQKFINSINFENDSVTIKFNKEDEIKDTNESIDDFCNKIKKIKDTHLFLNKLDKENLKKEDAIKIVEYRTRDISTEIDRIIKDNLSRDCISGRILNSLYDLCYAVMVLNAIALGYRKVNEQLAWEVTKDDINTKYLSDFLKGLKYIGRKIPAEGQSERLMLKYYNYLWEIRKLLKEQYNMDVLSNICSFPIHTDSVDVEYYEMVANSIDLVNLHSTNVTMTRYYIQKKTPFFVDGERYFEITLQLAGVYATKFNRITVYTKLNISTNYSIQIGYVNTEIEMWNTKNSIKVVTDWKVSIDPYCLNNLAKMLCVDMKLNKNYGEYVSLMEFLTRTGMNFFELVNLNESKFQGVLNQIYMKTNTHVFIELLIKIRNEYSLFGDKFGKYTVRYVLLNLREEIFESIFPNTHYPKCLSTELNVSTRCYPFEKNPFISNLAGKKTSKGNIYDILDITNSAEKFGVVRPYLEIEKKIYETGEIYFNVDTIGSIEEIKKYNDSLDEWERNNGYNINIGNNLVSIASYESATFFILQKILKLSKISNRGQMEFNERYIKNSNIKFEDPLKKIALKKCFANSQVMLIYGAAGTGKTTLINYISSMMNNSKKLFLTKTHTALQNLKRRVENPGTDFDFICIDSFTKKVALTEYDIIFVDECSAIDNLTMKNLLNKISEDTLLVLAGDIFQLRSIDFGNWFYYAKEIITTDGAKIELLSTWRTDKEELKSLWDEVREIKPIIIEKLAMDGPFSDEIGNGQLIFEEDNEVILCLNYDGKFGLNNMNQYYQNANTKSQAYVWNEWSFKVGDPIIFIDTKRSELLYNNLKGRIIEIEQNDTSISFTIDVETIFTERECKNEKIEFIDVLGTHTRIRLDVIRFNDDLNSEEDRIKTIIPFQIAYAVSIHKAQGLEYDSVKLIIPSCNAEKISHSVFYTAITRAKNELKIFWSAETMQEIVNEFYEERDEQRTLSIIKNKLGLK